MNLIANKEKIKSIVKLRKVEITDSNPLNINNTSIVGSLSKVSFAPNVLNSTKFTPSRQKLDMSNYRK
jgi:hypothetical protein